MSSSTPLLACYTALAEHQVQGCSRSVCHQRRCTQGLGHLHVQLAVKLTCEGCAQPCLDGTVIGTLECRITVPHETQSIMTALRVMRERHPAEIAAMVRHDVQQMATDVHVALGLKSPSVPPTPLSPPTGAGGHLAYPWDMLPIFYQGAQ